MPEKWLLVHCANEQQIRQRLPNSVRSDGTPLIISAKDAKPQTTEADVAIELILNQAKVEAYVEQAKEEIEKEANAAGEVTSVKG